MALKGREILAHRKNVLKNEKNSNPNRWSKSVRNCEPVGAVILNPDKPVNIEIKSLG